MHTLCSESIDTSYLIKEAFMARKLQLRKQTVRILTSEELRHPHGGIRIPERQSITSQPEQGDSRCDCWVSQEGTCNSGDFSDCNC